MVNISNVARRKLPAFEAQTQIVENWAKETAIHGVNMGRVIMR